MWNYQDFPDRVGNHIPECQLNRTSFATLLTVLGTGMSASESDVFFDTLDVTGDGLVSYHEMINDYFSVGMTAIEFYIRRWRFEGSTRAGGGLDRAKIDYTNSAFRYF